jgi:hypothetical protein
MNKLLKILGSVALTLGIIIESGMIWWCYVEKDAIAKSIRLTNEIFEKES